MTFKDIKFDEDLELYITLPHTNEELCVVLSDDLEASEEILTEKYKEKISDFLNRSNMWYEKSLIAVKSRGDKDYNQKVKNEEVKLMQLFVLFEQDESELYGLEFWVKFDVEHGCGLKIRGEDFEIIEVGDADVAFS